MSGSWPSFSARSSFVSGSDDGTLRIWNVEQDQPVAKVIAPDASTAVAWSPTGNQLLSAGPSGQLTLWQIRKALLNEVR